MKIGDKISSMRSIVRQNLMLCNVVYIQVAVLW